MQKRLVLAYEGSLCSRKQLDVRGPVLGEAERYTARNGALTMVTLLTHTQSINPIQRYEILLAQLTKSVGES